MKKIAFTLLLASAFGSVFAQNLLTNGSFETETAAGSYGYLALSSTAAPDGWSFTPSYAISLSSATTYGSVEDGSWSIQFGAFGDPNSDSNPAQSSYDSLQQAVQTVAGASYTLTYWLYDYDSTPDFVFNATWNGSVIAGSQVSQNVPYNTWTEYSVNVVGTGGMDVLGLNGYDGAGFGGLDNASLVQNQAVPSPEGVLALGLGLVGLAFARRRIS